MAAYIVRRLLLIIPTLLGILLLNFAIIQAAPGGPVERMVSQLKSGDHHGSASTGQYASARADMLDSSNQYRGSRGLPDELVERIEKMYGFDKPRSEEHTSELQSRFDLVCRLLLEKKKLNIKLC